eukprot:5771840-Pyramimonas_sp.AAC.1
MTTKRGSGCVQSMLPRKTLPHIVLGRNYVESFANVRQPQCIYSFLPVDWSPLQGPRGGQWEKVGSWTQGKKRGRVSGVLRAPLPLLAQED